MNLKKKYWGYGVLLFGAVALIFAFLMFLGTNVIKKSKTQEPAEFSVAIPGIVRRSTVHSLFGGPGFSGQSIDGPFEEWFFEKNDLKRLECRDLSEIGDVIDLDDLFRKDGYKIRIYYDENAERVVNYRISEEK